MTIDTRLGLYIYFQQFEAQNTITGISHFAGMHAIVHDCERYRIENIGERHQTQITYIVTVHYRICNVFDWEERREYDIVLIIVIIIFGMYNKRRSGCVYYR